MIYIALSAAFVGFLHSLSPGHWLPVVLLIKIKNWNTKEAFLASLVAASGHVLSSVGMGLILVLAGHSLLADSLEKLEHYSGYLLIALGVIYIIHSRFQHRHCHGHEHHGPDPDQKKPYLFLFSLGLAPCFAALPIFVTALSMGSSAVSLTVLLFSLAVILAFSSASILVSKGLVKLDHPVLEHHGEVIAGVSVVFMGIFLLLFHHHD